VRLIPELCAGIVLSRESTTKTAKRTRFNTVGV